MWLPRFFQREPMVVQIAVSGRLLSVDDQAIPLPDERGALIELFGAPSMVWNLVNTLSVWDDLGLVTYQRPGGGPVYSLSVILGELCGYGFWPRRPFPGRLTLDGAAVTPDTTIDGINAAKAGRPLIHAGGGCCWHIDYGDVVVAVNTARAGHFAEGGRVAELVIDVRVDDHPQEQAAVAARKRRGRAQRRRNVTFANPAPALGL